MGRAWGARVAAIVDHNYVDHNYLDHNYIDHNYIDLGRKARSDRGLCSRQRQYCLAGI